MPPHESTHNTQRRLMFTGDQLRMRLRQYDRMPFLDLLAAMLECAPTEADLRRLARTHPDRYITALGQLARTSGFTDKTEVNHNVNLTVGKMSDSQIMDRLRELQDQIGLPAPNVVDADYEMVPASVPDDTDSQ